jgi:hypothetical protein
MSTTIKNESKRLAKILYMRGIIPSLEKQEEAEKWIVEALSLYGGQVLADAKKRNCKHWDEDGRECATPTTTSNIMAVLNSVTEYAARNCCLHEETYRGGTIWEICSMCGMKWADDEGGMPTNAREYPKEIDDAMAVLENNGT